MQLVARSAVEYYLEHCLTTIILLLNKKKTSLLGELMKENVKLFFSSTRKFEAHLTTRRFIFVLTLFKHRVHNHTPFFFV